LNLKREILTINHFNILRFQFSPFFFFALKIAFLWDKFDTQIHFESIQGSLHKLLLATKESIVSGSIFFGPPCIVQERKTISWNQDLVLLALLMIV